MHKIYLVSPSTEVKFKSPCYSLEYIKYYIMDNGYDAEIIDCSNYDSGFEEVITIFKEDEKPIIGITSYTRERFYAYDLIRKIRLEIPDSCIVVGGRHFSCLADETLKNLPEVDIVVRGEGEITFKEICDSVYCNKSLNDIKGISFREEDRVVHSPERPLERNLDMFRSFDRKHLPDLEKHSLTSKSFKVGKVGEENKNMEVFTIMASRGCPNSCVFCSLTAMKVRFRDIDNVLDEIEEKIKVTGIRYVKFIDSSLTITKSYVRELCEKIIKRKMGIKWICYSRVDIDLEILRLMKKAGLVGIEIALESGSPRVLKSIKKRIDIDLFERICKEAYKLGIKVFVFCLISLPDEKIEDVDMTLSAIRRMSQYIYQASMQSVRILPDAAIYNIAMKRGLLPSDFDWFKPYTNEVDLQASNPYYSTIPLYLEHLSQAEITEKLNEFDKLVSARFSDFNIIKRALKTNMKMDVLKNLTLNDLRLKTRKTFVMFKSAYSNRGKLKKFQ
jgi:magnesium-protoporphyrin IX monomethyl ester (oxidative) cyclase